MAKRYLTVEDIERAGGAEIVVEPGTVVTPQALEYADSRGIVLRGEGGRYVEPAPDRGPDADFAMRELPHLPEPREYSPGEAGAVVTAVGVNRPGVLAEVTATLSELRANVIDVSQKMTGPYFHLILTVDFGSGASFEDAKARLQCLGGEDDYVVRVMHERVFRFMHRV